MEILDDGLFKKEYGEFVVFQQFQTADDLADFTTLMRDNGIAVRPQQESDGIGDVFTGGSIKPKFWAEIQTNEFTKAKEVLKEEAERHLSDINLEEHYLNDLSDGELSDVLLKPDEWNSDALLIAEKLLEKRGKVIDKKEIQKAVEERKAKLRAPKTASGYDIGFNYLLIALGVYLVFYLKIDIGLIPTLFPAWQGRYLLSIETDTDGNQHLLYDEKSRSHGRILMYLVSAFILIRLGLFIWNNFINTPY